MGQAKNIWRDTSPNEYKEVVGIAVYEATNAKGERRGTSCGGLAVGQCVLTGAHCLGPETYESGFAMSKTGEKVELDLNTIRMDYLDENRSPANMDIALIRLKSPLTHSIKSLNSFVDTPIPSLPVSEVDLVEKGKSSKSVGSAWIATHLLNNKTPGQPERSLTEEFTHQIEGQFSILGDAGTIIKKPELDGMILLYADPFVGEKGDSGSPLYMDTKGGTRVVLGVYVSGEGAKYLGKKGTAVSVAYHWDWFTKTLEDLQCGLDVSIAGRSDILAQNYSSGSQEGGSTGQSSRVPSGYKERRSLSTVQPSSVPNIEPSQSKRRVNNGDSPSAFKPSKNLDGSLD